MINEEIKPLVDETADNVEQLDDQETINLRTMMAKEMKQLLNTEGKALKKGLDLFKAINNFVKSEDKGEIN